MLPLLDALRAVHALQDEHALCRQDLQERGEVFPHRGGGSFLSRLQLDSCGDPSVILSAKVVSTSGQSD